MKLVWNGHSSKAFCINDGFSLPLYAWTYVFLIFSNDLPGINYQLDISTDSTAIYCCLNNMSDRFDTVKLKDDLKYDLESHYIYGIRYYDYIHYLNCYPHLPLGILKVSAFVRPGLFFR